MPDQRKSLTGPQARVLDQAARFLDQAPRDLPDSHESAAMWWAGARATIRDIVNRFADPEEDDEEGERCAICGAHPGADGSHVVRVSGAHIAAAAS